MTRTPSCPSDVSTSGTSTKRSPLFFFSPLVTFQVEDTLFRVPREWLEQSETFSAKVFSRESKNDRSESSDSEDEYEKVSSESRVVLPLDSTTVTASAFEAFLTMLIPLPSLCMRKIGEEFIDSHREHLSKEELSDALSLATAWSFQPTRELCISYLGKLSLNNIEKIIIAKRFGISKWLNQGVKGLVLRDMPLTVDEVMEIGLELAVQVTALREKRLVKTLDVVKNNLTDAKRSKIDKEVCEEVDQALVNPDDEDDDDNSVDFFNAGADDTKAQASLQHVVSELELPLPQVQPLNELVPGGAHERGPPPQLEAKPVAKTPQPPAAPPLVNIKALSRELDIACTKEVAQLALFKKAAASVTNGKKPKHATAFEVAKKAARTWVEAEQAATEARRARGAA